MYNRRRNAKQFVAVGDVLEHVLQKHRPAANQALIRVWQIWEEVLDAGIAANARPAAFKKDLLLVHVANSTWLHHLRFLESDIIEKLNEALGGRYIKRIKMKIGTI